MKKKFNFPKKSRVLEEILLKQNVMLLNINNRNIAVSQWKKPNILTVGKSRHIYLTRKYVFFYTNYSLHKKISIAEVSWAYILLNYSKISTT